LRDVRWLALTLTVAAVALGGGLIAGLSDGKLFGWRFAVTNGPTTRPAPLADARQREIHQRFQQGVVMLHAKRHEHAVTAFHRVLELDPALPEAHVNMGFALVGLERFQAARDFFESAIALRREQVNAYYGLAVALEGLRDREGAIGAMRAFVHLARSEDPHLRKAHAALWEWEAQR
jgi:tetratricopeptide (TPR) repeat protein